MKRWEDMMEQVAKTPSITIPDGMLMGGPLGKLYKVFAPPWWRLDRWFVYWFATREKGTILVSGKTYRIVREYKVKLDQVLR